MIKRKNKGFSLIELLIVSLLSSIILIIIYNLNTGSLNMFLRVKMTSDALETKTPAVELLSRYFERWGTAVITDSGSTNEKGTLPKDYRYIYVPLNNANATTTDAITFYANPSGFGFVKSITGGQADLISCRLNDNLITTSNCYYVYRGDSMLPSPYANLPDTDSNIDSLSFATAFNINSGGKECVDPAFSAIVNSSIGSVGTVSDSDSPSISSITLQPGDMLFRSPYRVEIYVGPYAIVDGGDGQNWLFIRLTNVASRCPATTTKAIAPADSVSATTTGLGTTPNNLVQLKIVFRSDSKINNGTNTYKTFIVTKIFGGV